MALAQKFLFDVSFDQPEEPAAELRKAPPEPTFTRAELEAARAEGAAQGRSAALAEAAQSAASRTAAALGTIETGIAALLEARAALVGALEQQALVLLRAALTKALPALCRKDPLSELEALVARCLGEALDEPRIVVRVGDALFDPIQKRLGAIAQANGFAGKLVLLAEPALADGDARIEWADGGAERDTSRLAAEIDAVLARALTPPPTGPSSSEENPDG
jgi:flagellar assembly protein FliH